MGKQKIDRTGEQKLNKWGSLMTILEYNNTKDITVEFENGYKVYAQYNNFLKGNIKSPYDKTIYNIGYIGDGEYGVDLPQYDYWKSMLRRCYDEKALKRDSTYEDKYVCEEWHNYQTFAKWFDENYYECNDGYVMDLDKDILNKGNKIYSPETCIFVSHRINTLFTKRNSCRGDYPIGVSKYKGTKYKARCSVLINGKREIKNIGSYDTPEEAFCKYKEFKENYIKEVAEEYRDLIPVELYEAMVNYVVNIDD